MRFVGIKVYNQKYKLQSSDFHVHFNNSFILGTCGRNLSVYYKQFKTQNLLNESGLRSITSGTYRTVSYLLLTLDVKSFQRID